MAPWFPKAALAIDLDRVPALSEDRERLWAQVSVATLLSDDEKRGDVGPEESGPGEEAMKAQDMLAQLVAQAVEEGAELVTLRAVVEEASEVGAELMLAGLGLDDDKASADLIELRQLLRAWRDAKASAWKAAIEWLVRGFLALLLVGIAYRMGVATELLK